MNPEWDSNISLNQHRLLILALGFIAEWSHYLLILHSNYWMMELIYQPNKDLDFTKAQHYVVGYENMLSKDLFLKVELYYQHLYSVPVEDNDTSSFSAVNYSWGYTDRKLINEGSGQNYGMELTFEKYFSKNYYYLFTASLYNSEYTAADGKREIHATMETMC